MPPYNKPYGWGRVRLRYGLCVCVKDPRFDDIILALQLQWRGTGGEHTAAVDDVYDISNRARLKKSEASITSTSLDDRGHGLQHLHVFCCKLI